MSQTRPIWNDGQGLATPDLQRPCDLVGAADDRVHEVLFTPGAVQKKILPLTEETAAAGTNGFTGNPRLLAVPSTVGLTPAGVAGGLRVLPCELIAGVPSASQQVALAATLYAPLDSAPIAGNSSGSIRYDLVYATVSRAVSVTGTRKIKSATDGTLSSQTVNLADAPAVTLGVNAGFLTGATAPTLAQINAALPADTAPSSSTFGSFSFPVAYVTVANGYTGGTTLFQNSTGGSTYITQCWSGGALLAARGRGPRPMTFYSGAANERPGGSLQTLVGGAERWGSGPLQFFGHFKILPATGTQGGSGLALDTSIDWRKRFIWGFYVYLGSATTFPLDTQASPLAFASGPVTATGSNPQLVYNTGVIPPVWSGGGVNPGTSGSLVPLAYTNGSVLATLPITVSSSDGTLRTFKTGAGPVDGTNGDALAIIVFASDQIVLGG